MERIFTIAAGIDVHRDTVVVSIRRRRGSSTRDALETRTFETFHDSLLALSVWLVEQSVEAVGLESTGVYWKPVARVLQREAPKLLVWLVNPSHVKQVPGRKTDVIDSQWLSKLVMYGLVAPSYLCSLEQEELRKLTRYRTKLVADQVRCKNRIHKELESSGVKLGTVCTDVLGKSGRAMIQALLDGSTDAKGIANLACGTLRQKIPLLERAVASGFSRSCAFVLRQLLTRYDGTLSDIAAVDAEIASLTRSLDEDVKIVCSAPGIDQVAAAAILAEMGSDMSLFPSAKHLAAWSGLSPGSCESAGKAKRVPTRKGDKYLRTILVQCAWAAVRTKASFWRSKFSRLAPRLGPKKAIIAIARRILVAVHHMLRERTPYQEPAQLPTSPERRDRLARRYVAQIKALGFEVSISSPQHSVPVDVS